MTLHRLLHSCKNDDVQNRKTVPVRTEGEGQIFLHTLDVALLMRAMV